MPDDAFTEGETTDWRDPYDPDFEEMLDEQRKVRAEYPNLRRGMQPLDPDDEPSFLHPQPPQVYEDDWFFRTVPPWRKTKGEAVQSHKERERS